MKTLVPLVFIFLILCSNIYSQDDSIISVDHSKITLSTDIVPQWKVQVEVGGSSWYSNDSYIVLEGTMYEYSVSNYHLRINNPSLAFRVGILKNVELRAGFVFIQDFHSVNSTSLTIYNRRDGVYGGGPIEAGAKIKFFEGNKYFPSAAINVNLFIPAGNYYFHMDYVSPSFKLMLQKNISKKFSLSANAGYGWNVYDYFTEKYGNYSISLNTSLSKKINAFAEAYSYFQYKRTPDHRVGAGLTYLFSRNVMAIIAGGIGLSERSPDLYGSCGIGFRFP